MSVIVKYLPHEATVVTGGLFFPKELAVVVRDDPEISPYDLDMVVGVLHGRPICLSLTAVRRSGGPPVTRGGLNSTQVEKLIRRALTYTDAGPLMRSTPVETGGWRVTPLSRSDARDAFSATRPRLGSRGDPAERQRRIERAAAMYNDLIAAGIRHPKPPIAKELMLSPSYVGALLGEARKQGLVPPSPGPGRASAPPTEPGSAGLPPAQQDSHNASTPDGTS